MDWAARRKFLYVLIVFLVLGTVFALVFRNVLYQPATCTDNRKNGMETGVDCGGACARYCPNTLSLPKLRWVRSFPVAPGFVHALASLEHNYPNTGLRSLTYEFTLFDAKNEVITTRRGETFIGAHGRTVIIEPLIQVGNRTPVLTRFEILSSDSWEKFPDVATGAVLKVERTELDEEIDATRLTAILQNQSLVPLEAVQVVAILYDENDNAITASKTELPRVAPGTRANAYFTWSFPLTQTVARIEILPRINPFVSISSQ